MFPISIQSKNGIPFTIKEASEADAKAMIQHVQVVGGETSFLTFGAGENKITVAEELQVIEAHRNAPNQLFLVAYIGENLVSIGNIHARSNRPRLLHIGEFGISVQQKYWGLGIGKAMIKAMLDWAKASNVLTKMNLTVDTSNKKAIQLYEKLGFEYEGLIRRDMLVDGKYRDSYRMGMLL